LQILEYMATGAYKIFLDFDLSTVHLHGCMLGNDVASYTELDWPEKSHLRFIGYSTADRADVLSEVISSEAVSLRLCVVQLAGVPIWVNRLLASR